jgi:hypothetical protein
MGGQMLYGFQPQFILYILSDDVLQSVSLRPFAFLTGLGGSIPRCDRRNSASVESETLNL